MDTRLLRYYDRELRHLQTVATEFAREFPKVAGRLALDDFPCVDPYVERLLEGMSFLSARVQLKLDAEFPRFTQNLLEVVYPHYLGPTPSMVVAQLEPDYKEAGLAEGYVVPRGTVLRSVLGKGDVTSCEYRTAHDVTLWPMVIEEAQYYTRDMALLNLQVPADKTVGKAVPMPRAGSAAMSAGQGVRSAIRIRLSLTAPGLTFNKTKLEHLDLHLHGGDVLPPRLFELIVGHIRGVVVRPVGAMESRAGGARVAWQSVLEAGPGDEGAVKRLGMSRNEALLPYDARSFQGYRLVHEYFALLQRYLFTRIQGLAPAMQQCAETKVDIILLLDTVDEQLEGAVDASHIAPYCTPAVNLFPKRCDRVFVTDRSNEWQVIPDRTRPLDFEVYRVQRVTGYGSRTGEEREFRPFYAARDTDDTVGGVEGGAFYAINRVPRLLSETERRSPRSRYGGSEVWVSLVDSKATPYSAELKQLGVEALCTNRDLPLMMPVGKGSTDFTLDVGAPVTRVMVMSGPTAPRLSAAEGEAAWRLISHLSLNYLSLTDSDEREGAAGLREVLKLYADTGEATSRKQVEAVRSVQSQAITRRVPDEAGGPIAFARGLEVSVLLDESGFAGSGAFVLGSVLEQFFARYVSLNSFTETVVKTVDRGEIMRWGARLGQRPIF